MTLRVTILSLGIGLLAVGCHNERDAREAARVVEASADAPVAEPIPATDVASPAVSSEATAAPAKCVDVAADENETKWRAQLPAIIKFEFKTEAKRGVVATPLCVKDRAHTPDWDATVVQTDGLVFTTEKATLLYAPSVFNLTDATRFAKLEELKLTRNGGTWTGERNEIMKQSWIVTDLFGPVSLEIELPNCTRAQMDAPVVIPRTLSCP